MPISSAKRKAGLELTALFERNGYVRRQNIQRLSAEGSQSYKKGSEVRLMAKSVTELTHIRNLLEVLEFTYGRSYAQGRQYCLPIYGREQVSQFMALVGKRVAGA